MPPKRNDLCSAVILLVGLLAPSAAFAAAPSRICVLSYNIHHAEGTDGVLDLNRIAEVIDSVEPDVVALQEVDGKTARTGRVDQAAELARLTRLRHVYGKNIDFEGGAYGNAILSRWPLDVRENIVLPCLRFEAPDPQREQRGVLVADVQIPNGPRFTFAATHLDARRQDDERFESAQMINARLAQQDLDQPAILAGDLNATRDSRVIEEFRRAWTVVGDEEAPTVPADQPRRQIDFILYRPHDRWRIVETRVVDEPVASDHRPLVAILELKGAP